MKSKIITGTVSWQPIETGFWGITDEKGGQWRPVNMPEQLKKAGKKVTLMVREIDEGMSIFMWGTPVRILSFGT